MIKTARQLKNQIHKLSKEHSVDVQLLMRSYMMERFLERVSLSPYRDNFILKGGMLVISMVGLGARTTMDLDATIKGASVSEKDVKMMVEEIITIPVDDGVTFEINKVSAIMEEAEYPGVRLSMTTFFDGVRTHLKIDISTGDVITPKEVQYNYKLMLEDRTIDVLAYNIETVLAEKLEAIITMHISNSRMRDFYDVAILQKLHGDKINLQVLRNALVATAHKRGTEDSLIDVDKGFDEIENSQAMQDLWSAYQKKFSYASGLSWDSVMRAVRKLYASLEIKEQN